MTQICYYIEANKDNKQLKALDYPAILITFVCAECQESDDQQVNEVYVNGLKEHIIRCLVLFQYLAHRAALCLLAMEHRASGRGQHCSLEML